MPTANLKPCPFCGGKPVLLALREVSDGFDRGFTITCDPCDLTIGGAEYESDVFEQWNTRVPDSVLMTNVTNAATAISDLEEFAGLNVQHSKRNAVAFAFAAAALGYKPEDEDEREETTLDEVVARIRDGKFYEDYDWACGPALRVLQEILDIQQGLFPTDGGRETDPAVKPVAPK